MRIDDKVAVVTGGASGLGKATVRMLHEAGAQVAILDMNKEAGSCYAIELGEDSTIYVATDVTSVPLAVRSSMTASKLNPALSRSIVKEVVPVGTVIGMAPRCTH